VKEIGLIIIEQAIVLAAGLKKGKTACSPWSVGGEQADQRAIY
jgi:hypothetical protein